jgi:glutathione S-transferase
MIRIWGRRNSSNVAKVLWATAELGVAVERIDVGGPFGGTAEPAYRAMNPAGQIPTLEHDGFVLWESNAIVRYLASSFGAGSLLPDGERSRAVADQWMDYASTAVAPAIDALRAACRKPEASRDAPAVAAALQAAADRWGVLDTVLARHPFLAGDRLTTADIAFGALIHRWSLVPLERPAIPGVDTWHRRLAGRPAFAAHIADAVA